MSKSNRRRPQPPVWVSQNYLTGAKTIQCLLNKTSICGTDRVLEIGSGKGHITRALARRCGSVLAVELDPALCSRLRHTLGAEQNVRIVQHDFLSWRLPDRGDYKVFSNIPFSITTQILCRLTRCPNPPSEAWLLMEKGAARRFMGQPRESLRSLMLKPWFSIQIASTLRRENFHPMPSVDVVMLHLKKKTAPDLPYAQLGNYERFLRAALNKGPSALLSRRQIHSALAALDSQSDKPSGEMLYVQWLCLFQRYAGLRPGGGRQSNPD